MPHEELNPFAAPGSNTSTDSTTVGLRDLFKGSLKSILDGPEGALRTGLRITLGALLLGLCFSVLQSLFIMSQSANLFGGGFFAVIRVTSIVMAVGKLGEFVGACFLWKGVPQKRILAGCCCGMLVVKFLFDYLMPRFLSTGEIGIAMFIVSTVFGIGFSVTRLLLLKQLTKNSHLHVLANIAIAGTCAMTLISIASFYWQITLMNTLNFSTPTGKLIHAGFLFFHLIISGMEIRVAYRLLCEKLTASVDSFATTEDTESTEANTEEMQ